MANFFYYKEDSNYPADTYYRPSKMYPEYPFKENGISESNNQVYDMIRELFHELKMDIDNYGKKTWNPFKDIIYENDIVLIKPNMVTHINPSEHNEKRGLECLVTHPSVLKCIIDYAYIALKGTGKIIVADAPIQDCDFTYLKRKAGFSRIEDFYRKAGIEDFEIYDLREVVLESHNGNKVQKCNKNKSFKSTIVNLGKESYFYGKDYNGKLRITNYDSTDVNEHHNKDRQEYCVNNICLEANVIISLSKPKTHRLAGYTGALKNFVGINAKKEYLPHHCKGSIKSKGDEYPKFKINTILQSNLDDLKNKAYHYNWTRVSKYVDYINQNIKNMDKNAVRYGMWYKNDTMWRTILDLNFLINFCDKKGKIQPEKQRKIIHIGDMIVCGEKEGPLAPSYKKVGGILYSDNAVEFDIYLLKIMGFELKNFPTIKNAIKDKRLFKKNIKDILFMSNCKDYIGKYNVKIKNHNFEPTSGWKGHV